MDNFSYSASKAGLIALTRHLAANLARSHITVNAIAPGMFPSRMTAFLYETEQQRQRTDAMVPLGRSGNWEDAAGPAIFLASRAAAFVTGATLVVDGGLAANA
jgi:NAD(P)-dependent dehydrogenase (short-subunit alcohol dehydrogenase family)